MDTHPSALWLAQAARLSHSAQALAAVGDTSDLPHLYSLNSVLEARLDAYAAAALPAYAAAPIDFGYSPAPSSPTPPPARPRPRGASMRRESTAYPVQWQAPLTTQSPVAAHYLGDLTWAPGADVACALRRALQAAPLAQGAKGAALGHAVHAVYRSPSLFPILNHVQSYFDVCPTRTCISRLYIV